jgi:aarF domain-containing kinase
MDHKALGSAAIGQCHRAILKSPWDSTDGYEGGKIVAVKVMQPGAEQRFAHDFQIFRWLCRIALPGWKPILNEIQRQMKTEFDYRDEAKNLDEVRINMLASPYSDKVTVPQPIHSLCSKNLLVMEMLEGKKFSDAIEQRLSKAIGSADAAKEFIRRRRETLVMGVSAHADATKHENNANEFVEVGKDLLEHCGVTSWIGRLSVTYRLLQLHRYVHRCIELMLDVHGHQIFLNGVFNGDCHPGNLMELSNGKIGLIDYGQTKRLTKEECVGIARVVSALGQNVIDEKKVGEAMRQFGFRTKNNSDKVLTMYAKLFFDSDDEAKAEGCVTPQLYLMKLSALDPLVQVPDAAIMTARTSYMFRGIGAISGDRIRTSKYWRKNADKALESS